MKILLAIDGSRYSKMATDTINALKLPPETEMDVMTVIPEHTFIGGVTFQKFLGGVAARERTHRNQKKKASELLREPVSILRDCGIKAGIVIRWGIPADQILKQANEMNADLIVIGAKGIGDSPRFPMGSVAQKVVKYSGSSVLIVRESTKKIRRILLATDGSKYSETATRFLIDLSPPGKSEIFLITSLQSHILALLKMPSLDLDTNRKILAELMKVEEEEARSLMSKTAELFQDGGYITQSMLLYGDPAEEILNSAKTLYPDIIALGAKGLTGIESFLMGSVSQRVARFAECSVLIVRLQRP